jgi:hypothetical protein
MNHQRRMKEIALNNSGKKEVADVSGKIKLDSQDRAAYNQSRLLEQKKDRVLPLTELESDPPQPEVEEENIDNPLPNILK